MKLHAIIVSSEDNIITFCALKKSFKFYKDVIQKPWRSRLFSCAFASLFIPKDLIKNYEETDEEENNNKVKIEIISNYTVFYYRVGLWTVFWLFLINLIFIILKKNFSLFYMFGIFSALSIIFIPLFKFARVYPWDMPILFFFCLFIYLLEKKKLLWLIIILPIATGFKETVILLSFIFLVWEEVNFKKRIIYTLTTIFLCVLVKSLLGIITSNEKIFFTMIPNIASIPNIFKNIFSIFYGNLNNLIFINAGTTVAFFLLYTKDKYILCLKGISLLFLISNLIFGNYLEYRIFIELIPIALYGFDKVLIQNDYFFNKSGH